MSRRASFSFLLLGLVACGSPGATTTSDARGEGSEPWMPPGVDSGSDPHTGPAKGPGSDDGQTCPPDRVCDFDMELGFGLSEYQTAVAGEPVPLTLGPQGGFHMWLATRCYGCPDKVLIEYGVRDTDGAWMWGQSLQGIVNLQPAGEWLQVVGLYGMMPGVPGEIDYLGEPVDLDITIHADVKPEADTPRASRVVRVLVGDIVEWDCPSSIPEECD